MAARAIVFIDGNNWYHSLRRLGLGDLGRLDYAKISRIGIDELKSKSRKP